MRLLVLLMLAAACSRVTAASPSGRSGAGGSDAEGGSGGVASGGAGAGGEAGTPTEPGPWSVPQEGNVDPLLLAADESHVIYGVHEFTEGTGSLHILPAGGEAFEASPSVLLAFPEQTFLQPPPGVLPAPGDEVLVAAVPPGAGERFGPPYLVAVRTFVIATRTWIDLVPSASYGVWSFVPGTEELLYVDGDRRLRRVNARGGSSRVLAERVTLRDGYPFEQTARFSPRCDHLSLHTDDGPALVDLATDRLRLLPAGSPSFDPPAFSRDGDRVAVREADASSEAFVIFDVSDLARRSTPRARGVSLSDNMRHALVLDGDGPFTATLVRLDSGARTDLGTSVVRASFDAGGRVVWLADEVTPELRGLRLVDVATGVEEQLPFDSCRPSPYLQLDPDASLVVWRACDDSDLSVLRRADGAIFELVRGPAMLADPRGLLLLSYESSGNGRLHTWLAHTGELHDRGLTTFTLLLGETGERALVQRPGPENDLVLIDPLDPSGTWVLGTSRPTAWALGRHRVAWSDGERVWLADVP